MKQIVLETVYMENFCCYISPMILDLEKQGLTAISGPNGVGKTTMLDAIPYAFYGVTTKGLRGDDVVNDKVGKNCVVGLKFRVNENKYEVTRYVKHYKNGNTAHLMRDGVLIKKGHTEVKAEIERLLIPQKLFFNTLLFGQKIKSFFTDLTDAEQKEIFRNIINLNKYVIYKEEANKKLDDLNKDLIQITTDIEINSKILEDTEKEITKISILKDEFHKSKEKELKELKDSLSSLENQLNTLKDELDKIEEYDPERPKEIEKRIKELVGKSAELKLTKNNIKTDIENRKKIKISSLEKQVSEEKSKITTDDNNSISLIKEEISEIKIKNTEDLNRLINENFTAENSVKELDKEENKIKDDLHTIVHGALSGDDRALCPTCKQRLKSIETIEIFKSKKVLLETRLEDIHKEKDLLSKERLRIRSVKSIIEKEFEGKISELNNKVLEIQSVMRDKSSKVDLRLSDALKKLDSIVEKELSEKNLKIDSEISTINLESNKLQIEKDKIDSINLRKQNIETSINTKNIQIDSKKTMIDSLEKRNFDDSTLDGYKIKVKTLQTKISSSRKKLIDLNSLVKVYEFWKSAFSSTGIPAMLIDEAIPFMNKRVSYYLDKLSSGRFTMSFDTMKETKAGEFRDKISINIVDNNTHANSRTKLSGGQTRLIDIATILTLYDLQSYIQDIKFNILIFDEIFDSLDDENIKYVSAVIKGLVEDKSIFVISHRHIDQLEADNELNLWN